MNWVGGSRSRLVMKNDAKKQREFFEKTKIQQRLKNLGISLPASPRGTTSGSMDLVTLFIVNQIAAKKENKDPPKVAVLASHKGGSKHRRNEPLVLPMSPCSPSQLSLVESQPQYRLENSNMPSVQGTRKRKHVLPQGFRCRQLSPVQESAFSDNSASDYMAPITDPLSPFSSTSSAFSGQGLFPLQPNLQQRSQTQAQLPPHCSPPPWDTSGQELTKFGAFSQPRCMTDSTPWSCGSNQPLYQLETPTAAQVLFGPEPDYTEARDHAGQEVTYSLKQPGDREHMLDFTLNQSESEQQIEDIFSGFSNEECEGKGGGKLKIYLRDEAPVKPSTPQTVPDTDGMGVELSNCTDMNFPCVEHKHGPMNGCDCSSSYSCRSDYLSSDSNDEEECCQPCLQAASSCTDQACCADSLNPIQGSQGNLKQSHYQPRLLTPLLKPKMNFQDDQKVMEKVSHPDKALKGKSQQIGSQTAQFESPQALAQTQIPEPCKCRKTFNQTQDAGTQTYTLTAETCDASTQCSFLADSATKDTEFDSRLPPVDVSVQHPATGRQTDTASERNTHTPSPGSSGGKHTPWSKNEPWAHSLSGSRAINKFTANNNDGKVILQRPINPFKDAWTGDRVRAEMRGQEGSGCLMKNLSNEVREEVTSATRVSRHSEEVETLQEIADILLLLKQRKK